MNPPRSYYDSQETTYSAGHMPMQHGINYPLSTQSYHREAYDQQNSGPFYATSNDVTSPDPYYRAITPAISQSHRYTTSAGDPRYYQTQSEVASSSHIPDSSYQSPSTCYPSQYTSTGHHRGHRVSQSPQAQFIPTPSEIAHTYTNYPRQISVPHVTSPDLFASSEYVNPHRTVQSSRSPLPHRARISTGRPQTAPTSGTSPTSPQGERFACDRCGKTFSRSHDRKRHHETQHLASPVIHRCRYCEKEFSRADSLKRHLDNGCDEMPS